MNPMMSATPAATDVMAADIEPAGGDAQVAAEAARDRSLDLLARMGSDLRAPLHALLGGVQMLRLDGDLTRSQSACLETIMSAGTLLLERVFAILDLSDGEVDATLSGHGFAGPGGGAARQPASLGVGSTASGAPAARSLQVLVADDVAMNRDIAATFLRAAGHVVTVAENGADAFVAASRHAFDVILLDVRMPGMDGLEATRRIRTLPGERGRTPIVALTALALGDEVEECRRAGMTGHLAKPFRQDTLNEAVQRAVASVSAPVVVSSGPASRSGPAARDGMPSYLRVLAVERDRLGPANGAAPAAAPWIDIDSVWSRGVRGTAQRPLPSPQAGAAFTLRLRDVGVKGGKRRLVGPLLSCMPPQDRDQHEFHWLLYLHAAPSDGASFSGKCEMWRWHRAGWYSIMAPGAAFDAEEMFEQGWRYCGPCVDPVARVEVI